MSVDESGRVRGMNEEAVGTRDPTPSGAKF